MKVTKQYLRNLIKEAMSQGHPGVFSNGDRAPGPLGELDEVNDSVANAIRILKRHANRPYSRGSTGEKTSTNYSEAINLLQQALKILHQDSAQTEVPVFDSN